MRSITLFLCLLLFVSCSVSIEDEEALNNIQEELSELNTHLENIDSAFTYLKQINTSLQRIEGLENEVFALTISINRFKEYLRENETGEEISQISESLQQIAKKLEILSDFTEENNELLVMTIETLQEYLQSEMDIPPDGALESGD